MERSEQNEEKKKEVLEKWWNDEKRGEDRVRFMKCRAENDSRYKKGGWRYNERG